MPVERIDSLEKFRTFASSVVDPSTAQDPERARKGELNWGCDDGKWLQLFGGPPNDDNFWMWRELIRHTLRDEDKQVAFAGEKWMNPLHFVYISDTDPMKVAYTPDPEKGKRDIQVATTVGRYLTKNYNDKLSADKIRDLANLHREKWLEQQVQFTETEEDCERVYTTGPSSCMSHKRDHWGIPKHPACVYAGPDTKIAYLTRDGKITARAVVNMKDKCYARAYGDALLPTKLQKLGFTQSSSALRGARLKFVSFKRGSTEYFLLPYIDGDYQTVDLVADGGQRYLRVGDGGYCASGTGGYARVDGVTFACSDCEDQFDDADDLVLVHEDRRVCRGCLDEYYCTAVVDYDGSRAEVRGENTVDVGGTTYLSTLDLTRFGFERDDYGDWVVPSDEDDEIDLDEVTVERAA